ncbi:helix-turn-helix domain-containing protein [Methylobacterium sp. NPDC080182]|uniref:helix-turn-helix domain-containing protein n=1 Tax=Methylobacterium sp. NPDC080182 TaxID=3390590 RepID=UPI003CFF15ED
MSIGARIKELRVRHNQSLQGLADALGASKAHIWEIERGGSKNPSMELLKKLAEHFSVTVSYLVGEAPAEEDEGAMVLYRNLKELNENDKQAVLSLMKHFQAKQG